MKATYMSIVFSFIFFGVTLGIGLFGGDRTIFFDAAFAIKSLVSMPSFYFLFWLSLAVIWTVVATISYRREKHSLASFFFFIGAVNLATPIIDILEAGINHPGVLFMTDTLETFFNISFLFACIFFIQGFVYYAYYKIVIQPNCCQLPKSVQEDLLKRGHNIDNK